MMHICISKLTIIGPDNGLLPGRRQAIIWTNTGLLLIGPLETNFSEILIEILTFSFKKMHLKIESVVCETAAILSRSQCVNGMPMFEVTPVTIQYMHQPHCDHLKSSDRIFWLCESIQCLLMLWLLRSPEHWQAWYKLCRTDNMCCCSRINIIYLGHVKSKIWLKVWIYLL